MAMDRNPSQGFGTNLKNDWPAHESYWRENWKSRPYADAARSYEHYDPAYRYGHQSSSAHRGRKWDEVEGELRTGWDKYENRGQSKWEDMKDAVKDAWHRATT